MCSKALQCSLMHLSVSQCIPVRFNASQCISMYMYMYMRDGAPARGPSQVGWRKNPGTCFFGNASFSAANLPYAYLMLHDGVWHGQTDPANLDWSVRLPGPQGRLAGWPAGWSFGLVGWSWPVLLSFWPIFGNFQVKNGSVLKR